MEVNRQSIQSNGVDHIGIAVWSLQKALPFYLDTLGFSLDFIEEVEEQQVRVAMLSAGNLLIELLEPLGTESPIAQFINKRGEGIHHIGLSVSSINKRLKDLETCGFPLIDRRARVGAHDNKIGFLHPKASFGVLYELCERQEGEGDEVPNIFNHSQ